MTKEHGRLLFCFCGPTASGKSSICRKIVESVKDAELSVSTTTRPIRPGEKKGRDYFFVTQEEFAARVQSGSFVEYAQYNGNFYGTEYRNIDAASATNVDLLLDIEVQGVQQLKKRYGDRVIVVFVIPPSLAELEKRLRDRATETEEVIQSRLLIASQEIAILSKNNFSDYLLVNESLEESILLGASFVRAEQSKVSRNIPRIKTIISS